MSWRGRGRHATTRVYPNLVFSHHSLPLPLLFPLPPLFLGAVSYSRRWIEVLEFLSKELPMSPDLQPGPTVPVPPTCHSDDTRPPPTNVDRWVDSALSACGSSESQLIERFISLFVGRECNINRCHRLQSVAPLDKAKTKTTNWVDYCCMSRITTVYGNYYMRLA